MARKTLFRQITHNVENVKENSFHFFILAAFSQPLFPFKHLMKRKAMHMKIEVMSKLTGQTYASSMYMFVDGWMD